jgi:hypothetical protein
MEKQCVFYEAVTNVSSTISNNVFKETAVTRHRRPDAQNPGKELPVSERLFVCPESCIKERFFEIATDITLVAMSLLGICRPLTHTPIF